MRKSHYAKTKQTATKKAHCALKENGFVYNKSTKTWIRGGGFFNIEEMRLYHRNDEPNWHACFIVEE